MSDASTPSELYIGLMSGTSLDSIDAALVNLSNQHTHIVETLEHSLPPALREELIALCQPGENEIDRMGRADKSLGQEFAKAVKKLLTKSNVNPSDVVAIGSHGQTIRHRPNFEESFTLQVGDANIISHQTGIDTVADFRRKDMAAGGQGAPLAPAFHQATLGSNQHNRAIINIGGMANITFLSSDGESLAYDTGPGNILMDSWIQHIQQRKFDKDGEWASTGSIDKALLKQLLKHEYLTKPPPKSTGREDFSLNWLLQNIADRALADEDVQATLLELTAQTIYQAVITLPKKVNEIYICGGGAYNPQLMRRLSEILHPALVADTLTLGIPAQWVEAAAFAWLAQQTIRRKTGNLITATGANEAVVLGAIFPA